MRAKRTRIPKSEKYNTRFHVPSTDTSLGWWHCCTGSKLINAMSATRHDCILASLGVWSEPKTGRPSNNVLHHEGLDTTPHTLWNPDENMAEKYTLYDGTIRHTRDAAPTATWEGHWATLPAWQELAVIQPWTRQADSCCTRLCVECVCFCLSSRCGHSRNRGTHQRAQHQKKKKANATNEALEHCSQRRMQEH